jgi:hypothetical protein
VANNARIAALRARQHELNLSRHLVPPKHKTTKPVTTKPVPAKSPARH